MKKQAKPGGVKDIVNPVTPTKSKPSTTSSGPVPESTAKPATDQGSSKNVTTKPLNQEWVKSFNSIYSMQEQILALHSDIAKDTDFATKSQDGKSKDTTRTGPESGNSAFLNFMLDNYAVGDRTQHDYSNPQNVKYFDDPKSIGGSAKGKEVYDIRKMMESIRSIGKHVPGKDSKPDGVWGPYTNAALGNILIFAAAMLNLQNDLGIKSESYSAKDYNELKGLIPPDIKQLKNEEKVERAPLITKNIFKLRALFNEFKTTVFKNPEYKGLIQDETKFPTSIIGKFDNPLKKALSEGDYQTNIKTFNDNLNSKIFYINTEYYSSGNNFFNKHKNTYVTLRDLSSVDSFKEFLQRANITLDGVKATINHKTILATYNKIKEMVDNNQIFIPGKAQ